MYVLVTGGAGYIGSHTLIHLIKNGYRPVVLDNFVNSSEIVLHRVKSITGESVDCINADIRDYHALSKIFHDYTFKSVIHFAGLKAVSESVKNPILYYENNVLGSIQLFKVMTENCVKTIIFSSSATVYGSPKKLPLTEQMPANNPTNPYGISKLMIENILQSLHTSDDSWRIINLRYFNPIGAHKSGLMGEDPVGIPTNLIPYITQTAIGIRDKLQVFGNDYNTHDGTGIRDYIHVDDLANGHIKALKKIEKESGIWTVNLGTGVGYSVLDVIKSFEAVSNKSIPYEFVNRRPGDEACCYADPSFAKKTLDWEAKFNLKDMCRDSWRWQSMNPNGYS